MANRWLRAAVGTSVVWAALLSLIAAYEALTVDPWSFLGENMGPLFFRLSSDLVQEGPFGDFVLVFDAFSFWLVVILPVLALLAGTVAAARLARRIRRFRRYREADGLHEG